MSHSSAQITRPPIVTRRRLQVVLGGFWLLAGTLQCQPYMFTAKFADDVLGPAAEGQPPLVAAPMHWATQLIGSHPVPANVLFAAVQLLLGAGLLWGRRVPAVLAASIGWSLGVWWLGEGLGGLAAGHAMLLTGAPGAVLLYAMLAVAAWPSRHTRGSEDDARPRRFALAAWIAVWTLGAIYQLLPGQRSSDIAGALSDNASHVPKPFADVGSQLADALQHHGSYFVTVVVVQVLIALGVLLPGVARQVFIAVGCLLAACLWAFGQGFGQLFSGDSTDPNTGPLLIVLGVAAASIPKVQRRTSSLAKGTFPLRGPGRRLDIRRETGRHTSHPPVAVSDAVCVDVLLPESRSVRTRPATRASTTQRIGA